MSSATAPSVYPAPWGIEVKLITVAGTLACLAFPLVARDRVPEGTGPIAAGILYAPVILWLFCYLSSIRGYTLSGGSLYIQRLIWCTEVSLEGLESIDIQTQPFQRTIRLFGNPGLFAVTGLFYNRRIGRFRAFVTDKSLSCVLNFGSGSVAISPGNQRAFLKELLKSVDF